MCGRWSENGCHSGERTPGSQDRSGPVVVVSEPSSVERCSLRYHRGTSLGCHGPTALEGVDIHVPLGLVPVVHTRSCRPHLFFHRSLLFSTLVAGTSTFERPGPPLPTASRVSTCASRRRDRLRGSHTTRRGGPSKGTYVSVGRGG